MQALPQIALHIPHQWTDTNRTSRQSNRRIIHSEDAVFAGWLFLRTSVRMVGKFYI